MSPVWFVLPAVPLVWVWAACRWVDARGARHVRQAINAYYVSVGVELPRGSDSEPKRWRLPSGLVVGEVTHAKALALLKFDAGVNTDHTHRDETP